MNHTPTFPVTGKKLRAIYARNSFLASSIPYMGAWQETKSVRLRRRWVPPKIGGQAKVSVPPASRWHPLGIRRTSALPPRRQRYASPRLLVEPRRWYNCSKGGHGAHGRCPKLDFVHYQTQ